MINSYNAMFETMTESYCNMHGWRGSISFRVQAELGAAKRERERELNVTRD